MVMFSVSMWTTRVRLCARVDSHRPFKLRPDSHRETMNGETRPSMETRLQRAMMVRRSANVDPH